MGLLDKLRQKETCDICGKEFENLGVHKYHAHREFREPVTPIAKTVLEIITGVDEVPQEKPLNDLISEIKNILNRYQNTIETKIVESGGKVKEIQITARILL